MPRVALLGAGKIAQEHARALNVLGAPIVAGCCTSPASPRWQAFAGVAPEARFEPKGEALLSDPEVDAVIVGLPWCLTERWLPQLLAAPKPVLIEKPIALSAKALRAALARPDGRVERKWVGFNRRFYAPVQRLRSRLQEGGLKAVAMTISEPVEDLARRFGAELIPSVFLASSAAHILDVALYLLGPLKVAHVYGHEEEGYPRPCRSFTGILETAQRVPVMFSIFADAPVAVGLTCHFDDRTAWVLSPMERLVAYRGMEIVEPTPAHRVRRYLPTPFLECVSEAAIKPGFLEQMRAFLTGEGRETAATPADSLVLLDLLETIQHAATSSA